MDNDRRLKIDTYSNYYRDGIKQEFWLNLKEDLENVVVEKRKLASKELSKNNVEEAKRFNILADGIEEAINRPQFIINHTSGVVYELCDKCRSLVSKVKSKISV